MLPADNQPGNDRGRHGRDHRVSDFCFCQVKVVSYHCHQRRDPEPSEDRQEECEPGHVEGPRVRSGKTEQFDVDCFAFE